MFTFVSVTVACMAWLVLSLSSCRGHTLEYGSSKRFSVMPHEDSFLSVQQLGSVTIPPQLRVWCRCALGSYQKLSVPHPASPEPQYAWLPRGHPHCLGQRQREPERCRQRSLRTIVSKRKPVERAEEERWRTSKENLSALVGRIRWRTRQWREKKDGKQSAGWVGRVAITPAIYGLVTFRNVSLQNLKWLSHC